MRRQAAEEQYRQRRRRAFESASGLLRDALGTVGRDLQLREIESPLNLEIAMLVWGADPTRRVQWPWVNLVNSFRRDAARLELAVWHGDTLCGLALGRPSASRAHGSLHYVEGAPDSGHPLKGQVLGIVLTVLQRYSIVLGAEEMRIDNPLPGSPAHLHGTLRVCAFPTGGPSAISVTEGDAMKAHSRPLFATEEEDGLPPWDVVEARLADRFEPLPWLTPAGLAECARNGEPEISGPIIAEGFPDAD